MALGCIFDILLQILLITLLFPVRKLTFVSKSCVYRNITISDALDDTAMNQSHVYSAMWCESCVHPNLNLSPRLGLQITSRKGLLLLLLLMAGDIETCPGPTNPLFANIGNFVRNRGLKIFHQNVRGLHCFGKIEQLRLLMDETRKEIQIFGVTETHLNGDIADEEVSIPGYRLERKDRAKGSGGGVAIYMRDDLQVHRRYDLEVNGIECLWIEIMIKKSKPILLSIIYRPPDTSKYLDSEFETKFEQILNLVLAEGKEVILTGDLNCNYQKRADNKALKDIIRLNGFDQVIKEPTRVAQGTCTLIDVVLTNDASKVLKTIVADVGLSDHQLTGVIRRMHCARYKPRKIWYRDYSKCDMKAFKFDLIRAPWDKLLNIRDTNSAWRIFKEHLIAIIDNHAPLKERIVRGRDCPWLDCDLRKAMRERDFLLSKARKSGTEKDWSAYKRKRNLVTKMQRQNIIKYNRELLNEQANNPKKLWKQIKKCFPAKKNENSRPSNVFTDNGLQITEKKQIAERFCSFFINIAAKLQSTIPTLTLSTWNQSSEKQFKKLVNPQNSSFNFKQVSPRYVMKAINDLKGSKTPGFDNIPTSIIKDCNEILAYPLAHLINLSLETGIFPDCEKMRRLCLYINLGIKPSLTTTAQFRYYKYYQR